MVSVFFFFSFAYTTIPAAVMKLVVFFRSSKPFLVKRSCWRPLCDSLWLVSVTYLKKMLGCLVLLTTGTHWGKEWFLVSCACVRWACCGRSAVVPKPPGRACQEGGIHPSPFWVSALFWWWLSFPGNGCWLMVALLDYYMTMVSVILK